MKKIILPFILLLTASCGKIVEDTEEFVQGAGKAGESIVQEAGKIGEGFGQMPRNIANDLLGKDQDTEDFKDKTEQEIADLKIQLNDMYREILIMFANIGTDIDDVIQELNNANNVDGATKTELTTAINDLHTELADLISDLETDSLASHTNILQEINNTKDELQTVVDFIDGTVICDVKFRNNNNSIETTICNLTI